MNYISWSIDTVGILLPNLLTWRFSNFHFFFMIFKAHIHAIRSPGLVESQSLGHLKLVISFGFLDEG